MGKPLMLQESDVRRIERLKARLKTDTKVDVVRAGLELLEREVERKERAQRWKEAVALAKESSRETRRAFQKHSRLKRT